MNLIIIIAPSFRTAISNLNVDQNNISLNRVFIYLLIYLFFQIFECSVQNVHEVLKYIRSCHKYYNYVLSNIY